MGVEKMAGVPWHIESIHKGEEDSRRHKSRCIYYRQKNCAYLSTKCIGSAHCMHYEQKEEVNELEQEQVKEELLKRAKLNIRKTKPAKENNLKMLKRIQIGSRIKLLDLSDDSTSCYTIVKGRTDDSNDSDIKISESSPLAKALMGMTPGITIEVFANRYKITSFI